jgi:nucleoside-diphosphate-sugar epimerase
MAKVLVTGGAGYIGSILCETLLSAGHTVTVLDNLTYGQTGPLHLCANPRFEFVHGDCRDRAVLVPLLTASDIVIPLAAIVGADACARNKSDAHLTNREAIQMLTAHLSRDQRLIFPATNSGYGTSSAVCTENTLLNPLSLYARSKVLAEDDVLSLPNSVSLRLATVFGASPRMRLDLLVNHFTYLAVTQGYVSIYEPHFRRNYVHVRDVADCMAYCIDHPLHGPYNLGLDVSLSKEDLAWEIRAQVPNFQVHLAEVGSDPDKRDYVVSSEKLKIAGFSATRSLDSGIRELITAYHMLGRRPYCNA